jgi:pimeloyl-ACP methyl ester carboxylesterase
MARGLEPNFEGMPEIAGVEHRMVELDGFRAHVAEAGSGEPLLLLHGWPQHWYMWNRVIPLLAPHYRLIVPDLRGFGWSEAPDSPYGPEIFATDAFALLDALGIARCAAIGHDWGGYTLQLMGVARPERLRALVVCNVPHLWPLFKPANAVRQMPRSWYTWAAASPIGDRARSRLFRRMVLGGNVGEPFGPGEAESYIERLSLPERAHVTQRLYRTYQRILLDGARGRNRKLRLEVPTRILFGKRDVMISWRLLDGTPNATDLEIEMVPDSGHFIANEKPELVAGRAVGLFSAAPA